MQGAHSCIWPVVIIIYTAAQFVNSMSSLVKFAHFSSMTLVLNLAGNWTRTSAFLLCNRLS